MSELACLVSPGRNIVLVFNGTQHTISTDHPSHGLVKEMLQEYQQTGEIDLDDLELACNARKQLEQYVAPLSSGDKVAEVIGDELYYGGVPMHNTLSSRILDLMNEGFAIDYMLRFVERLMQNPSFSSREELLDFLGNRNMPITEDGCFLGYKRVTVYNGADFIDENGKPVTAGDYVSITSGPKGQVRNNIGDTPTMERGMVDDNRENHCSKGYHVGGMDYVSSFGAYHANPIVIVKVDPADAVSVPTDSSFNKLRTCSYEVMGKYQGDLEGSVWTSDASQSVNLHSVEWDDDGYMHEEVDHDEWW